MSMFDRVYIVHVCALILAFSMFTVKLPAADSSPEQLLAQHLKAVGPADARAAVKSRVVQGKLKFRIQVGGGGEVTGTWGRVSEQQQSNFVMRFAAGGDWRGEQFIYDGKKTGFGAATTSHTRSVFAQFVSSQDFIIKEGLLGGVLSTGWALENLDENHARVQVIGRKKIDGRDLVGLEYFSKSSSDMKIKLYFDPETYRHVLTSYTLEFAPNMNGNITESVYQHENRYVIEERFSDFQPVDGLTLPTHYSLQYTQEAQAKPNTQESLLGTTRVYNWDMAVEEIRHNLSLDPANFKVK